MRERKDSPASEKPSEPRKPVEPVVRCTICDHTVYREDRRAHLVGHVATAEDMTAEEVIDMFAEITYPRRKDI